MNMTFLLLARLKAIDVTEEPLSLKYVVFLHFLSTKLLMLRETYNLHLRHPFSKVDKKTTL